MIINIKDRILEILELYRKQIVYGSYSSPESHRKEKTEIDYLIEEFSNCKIEKEAWNEVV